MSTIKEVTELEKGLRGLDSENLNGNPKYEKWFEATKSLPEEERATYTQEKYDESIAWRKEQDLKKVFQEKIRPNTNIVFFWLGDKIIKEEKLLEQKRQIDTQVISDQQLEGGSAQNIGVPEIVDIDYSEIKKYNTAKNGSMLEPYKDGFLIVSDHNPKLYQSFQISDYSKNEETHPQMFSHALTLNKNVNYYVRGGMKLRDGFNVEDFNLYFVVKKAYKNKAFKINFKNNKSFKLIFDQTDVNKQQHGMITMLETIPTKIVNNYVEALGVIDAYQTFLDFSKKDSTDPGYENRILLLKDKMLNYSKDKLLKTGYYSALLTKFLTIVPRISSFLKNVEENPKPDQENPISGMFPDVHYDDFKAITQNLLSSLNDNSISYKEAIKFNEKILDEKDEAGYVYTHNLLGDIVNLIVFLNETEEGTSLPITGKINCSNATDIDCFSYWSYVGNFNLFNGSLGPKDFPLLLDDGKVLNEEEMYIHSNKLQVRFAQNIFPDLNKPFEIDSVAKIEISNILKEAMDQSTGMLIPYNACVELLDDPIFKYVRFIEYEKYIAIFVHDSNDRFITELYVKGEDEFRYWLYNTGQISDEETVKSSKLLYLKLAACIRDWKVLIERDSTMMVRSRPMVPHGVKTDQTRWIYLPRVKYKRPDTHTQKQREKVFFSESRKFFGERRQHRRKLPDGMKPSKAALLLAADRNMYLGEGHTYVSKSEWGKIKRSKREIKYRNTSLNGILFAPDLQIKKAVDINQLTPGRFEEKMEDYVTALGWDVNQRTNYDGGIDIRATRKKPKCDIAQRLLVQCKHPYISMKPIGPEVIRELIGSKIVEDDEFENVLMVITSSKFTPGAREIANKHDVILVDGDNLLE